MTLPGINLSMNITPKEEADRQAFQAFLELLSRSLKIENKSDKDEFWAKIRDWANDAPLHY